MSLRVSSYFILLQLASNSYSNDVMGAFSLVVCVCLHVVGKYVTVNSAGSCCISMGVIPVFPQAFDEAMLALENRFKFLGSHHDGL